MSNYKEILNALYKIETVCKKCKLNFIIVGSVAYKGLNKTKKYGDLDCVVVYDNINKLEDFNFLDKKFYAFAKKELKINNIDLFATKFLIEDVKVSMDFISIDYLKVMKESDFELENIFLKKMNNVKELPFNDYYSFKGEKYNYRKKEIKISEYIIYVLPKYLRIHKVFYSGVLHNKFIHNPQFKLIYNNEIVKIIKEIQKKYKEYYLFELKKDNKINIIKSIRNWNDFSDESKNFIKRVFNEGENL